MVHLIIVAKCASERGERGMEMGSRERYGAMKIMNIKNVISIDVYSDGFMEWILNSMALFIYFFSLKCWFLFCIARCIDLHVSINIFKSPVGLSAHIKRL